VPLARYSAPAIEKGLKDLDWVSACAVAHEQMVEHAARLGTAVPMKLFTLFSSDARARAALGRSQARLRAVLRRIEGRQEWGVRVSVDEDTARSRARERAGQAAAGLSAGAQFLTRKRQEHKEVRDIVDLGRTAADEVFAKAAVHADETRRRSSSGAEPGLRLLLDAAFLVPARREDAFRSAVRAQAERLAAHGYRVVLTGPWPAYNFVDGAR
jgi:gas vesicle protein GvpL/GvpF